MQEHIPKKYLVTTLIFILTAGVVLSLWGLQNNFNSDKDRDDKINAELVLSFCHSVADRNQRGKDVLLVLSTPAHITDDMTQAEKDTIANFNKRREAYVLIADILYPDPKCSDGYKATPNIDEAKRILEIAENKPNSDTKETPGG